MKWRKEYIVVLIIQITEVLGFSLVLPFLPLYAQSMGATPFLVGMIPASFSLLQFLSAPIMGKLSDRYGRKPLLILSQLSTFISFVVLAFANSIEMIFLSRAIDGLLGSNMTIAQAYLSDISSKKDRSKVFAISGIAFSVGFLIGPAAGGYLAKFSYSLPAFISAGISLMTIFLTMALLKETVKDRKEFEFKWKEILDLKSFLKYFSDENKKNRLWEFFAFVLTHAIWTNQMSLYVNMKFGWGTDIVGYGLAYVGLINVIIRGVFFAKIIDKFGEAKMKMVGMWSCLISFVSLAFTTQGWMLFPVFTFFAFGGSFVRPTLTGEISKNSNEKEQGSIMGVLGSLQSLSQIMGPLVGGYVLTNFAPSLMGWVPALVMLWSIRLALRNTQGKLVKNGK